MAKKATSGKGTADAILDALRQEREKRARETEAVAEGIVREHEIVPRVGRPPKR